MLAQARVLEAAASQLLQSYVPKWMQSRFISGVGAVVVGLCLHVSGSPSLSGRYSWIRAHHQHDSLYLLRQTRQSLLLTGLDLRPCRHVSTSMRQPEDLTGPRNRPLCHACIRTRKLWKWKAWSGFAI